MYANITTIKEVTVATKSIRKAITWTLLKSSMLTMWNISKCKTTPEETVKSIIKNLTKNSLKLSKLANKYKRLYLKTNDLFYNQLYDICIVEAIRFKDVRNELYEMEKENKCTWDNLCYFIRELNKELELEFNF